MPGVPADLPDLDWYLDHVVVPRGRDGRPVGPIRAWQACWQARAQALLGEFGASRAAAVRMALRQGFVVTRAAARAAGMTSAELRRIVRAGTWCAPHRGVVAVLSPAAAQPLGHATQYASHTLAAAASALTHPGHVISGPSAAVLHGFPRLHAPDGVVLTARHPSRMGNRGRVPIRAAGLHDSDVTTWHGAAVTTLARTIVDVARHDRASGLVAADAALHEGLVSVRS
jgi:predicted transcriptional regulator of viral defense system